MKVVFLLWIIYFVVVIMNLFMFFLRVFRRVDIVSICVFFVKIIFFLKLSVRFMMVVIIGLLNCLSVLSGLFFSWFFLIFVFWNFLVIICFLRFWGFLGEVEFVFVL